MRSILHRNLPLSAFRILFIHEQFVMQSGQIQHNVGTEFDFDKIRLQTWNDVFAFL